MKNAQQEIKTAQSLPFYLPLYVRPTEAAKLIGVSRRTLSGWQVRRVIPFRRVGRTILFSVADIQSALDKFTIAATPRPAKRRAGRIASTVISEAR